MKASKVLAPPGRQDGGGKMDKERTELEKVSSIHVKWSRKSDALILYNKEVESVTLHISYILVTQYVKSVNSQLLKIRSSAHEKNYNSNVCHSGIALMVRISLVSCACEKEIM